jgi:hypothetical protein
MDTLPTSLDPNLGATPLGRGRHLHCVFSGEIMVPVLQPRARRGQSATLAGQLETLRSVALQQAQGGRFAALAR